MATTAEYMTTDSATGTTSHPWQTLLTIDCQRSLAFLLKNTGGTNELEFRVLVEFAPGGQQHIHSTTPVTVPVSSHKTFCMNMPHAKVLVQAQSKVNGSDTTYAFEYTYTITP